MRAGARGFPVHAGIDPDRLSHARGRPRFPRTRGDRPVRLRMALAGLGVSPYTRG